MALTVTEAFGLWGDATARELWMAVAKEYELLDVAPICHFDQEDAAVELRWMRGRGSRLPWRRRRAHQACLDLIVRREYALGLSRRWPAHHVTR